MESRVSDCHSNALPEIQEWLLQQHHLPFMSSSTLSLQGEKAEFCIQEIKVMEREP